MSRRQDEEIDREIRSHMELEAEELAANGMAEDAARFAARRAFGNVTRTVEDVGAVWRRPWRDLVAQDMRYACRTLRKQRGFAATAVLTLALGIGANTAIFSVVNAVVLRPLPYPAPAQLMFLTTRIEGFEQFWVSAPEYFEFAEATERFSVVGALRTAEANVNALDRPRRVRTADVNAELFEALAVPAARGRTFTAAETRPGGPPVAVLSDALWRSAFGARADIVGSMIEMQGSRREVVGVMPAGFDVMDAGIDVWMPLQLDPANREEWNRNTHIVHLIGRLRPMVTPAQAQAELDTMNARWGLRAGAAHVFGVDTHALQMEPMQDEIVGSARWAILVLQAAVMLVLLIACTNVAGLLLARAEGRRREIAVQLALGAPRWRLLTQFTSEGLVVCLLGAVAGLVLARFTLGTVISIYPDTFPRAAEIAVDRTALAVTAGVALMTAFVFGLAPLLQIRRADAGSVLAAAAASRTATGGRQGIRRVLVASEVAVAVVLVAGAGLMLRTVANLMNVDTGVEAARIVTFGVSLPGATYPSFDDRLRAYRRLFVGLGAVPGVQRVAAMSGLPPQREVNAVWTEIEGYVPDDRPVPVVDYYQTVTSSYFETMGIPIVLGRAFGQADIAGPPVAIVNEAFVRAFWNGADPIGRRVRSRFGGANPWLTVVGVAKDVKQAGVDQPAGTEVYFMLDQIPRIFPPWVTGEFGCACMHVALRSTLSRDALQPAIARVVGDADATIPIIRLREIDEVVRESVRQPRMLLHFFGAFAGLALLLAALGTYGVLSWLVTHRRRELGIRMALGARRGAVIRQVMAQTLMPTAAGIVAGVAAAILLGRWMDTLLFEVDPVDPATLGAVVGAVLLVAVLAGLLPARRATRVDPTEVLRAD
jgi:predicted permease